MRKYLSKKEIKELNSKLHSEFGLEEFLDKKEKIEISEQPPYKLILRSDTAVFFYDKERIIPTLKLLLKENFLKTVTVDMGAVKFVANGADIMRPGIVAWAHGIKKDELVVIEDETHHKPLAVGLMKVTGDDLQNLESGKVIENVHQVGDVVWKIT